MTTERPKLIKGKPASYSSTSAAEIESRNIFYQLIDTRFIKGEIRVLDKYPNSDGILEITDSEGIPIGKIDIQLKTLKPRNYSSPVYSCEREFFAYCENSAIPVILIVVNRKDKVAYWRHVDYNTLLEVSGNLIRKNYTVSIPKENCIDGNSMDYLETWTQKAKEVIEKVWNYDSVKEQKKLLEEQLKELDSKMQNPTRLPLLILKDIHKFLDSYNYILDMEFGAIKQVLYPDYWKIGIGIISYEIGNIKFLLYPVEFKKSQTLVKEVRANDYADFFKEMYQGNILLLMNLLTDAKIRKHPSGFAYEILEESISKVAGKYNFPIADEFIAHEYLISFIDRNHGYLDMEKGALSYQLKDLKFKLYSVLPMIAATEKSYADWVVEYNDDIDSYSHWKSSEQHKKRIKESVQKIREGFIPKVKVTMTSGLYNIDLITYYVNFLESKGVYEAKRKYKPGQRDENIYGNEVWKAWNKQILWSNLKLFLDNFHRLYEKYLKTHFPYIQDSLAIVLNDEITIVYILQFDEIKGGRPFMDVYYLRCSISGKGEVLYFLEEDPNKPIDRIKFGIENKWDCMIDGIKYEILSCQAQVLDFMFTYSPMYTLINEKLSEKIRQFFADKKRKD